jgi:predicted Zn-dependent protease with MMP-like domain
MRLTHKEFDAAVEEALRELPPQFAKLLENISIVVEEEPSEEDLELLDDEEYDDEDDGGEGPDDEEESELLGIYRGIALTERSHDMLPLLPDQIAIFRGPIQRVARTRREAIEEIRDTVIHELGHYFGLAEEVLPQ